MKQILIRRGSPIVVDVPAPQLTDNSILVEVFSSLISTGTELAGMASAPKSIIRAAIEDPGKVTRGLRMIRESGFQRTMTFVNNEIDGGAPTGYSCAGKVLAVGKLVSGFVIGGRVACAGAGKANHAEVVAVPQNLVVHVPEACDLESASSATLGAIAIQGVRRADLRLGEFAAVIGLGLIGQLTVQLLNAAGCRTIGIDVDDARISLAKKFGLQVGVNSAELDAERAVAEFTGGRGADAVIIAASSDSAPIVQQAVRMVRRKGKVVVVGAVPLELQRSPFYEKEADLLISCSYGPGRYDPAYEDDGIDYPYGYVRWTENRNMAEYLRLIAEGRLNFKGLVEKVWPLDEAVEAYKDLKENRRIAVLLTSPELAAGAPELAAGAPELAAGFKLRTRIDVNSTWKSVTGQIRVGIIGPGSFVRAVHLPNLKQTASRFILRAVAARTGSTAWNIARQFGAHYATTNIDDLLSDAELDMVMIASRHDSHAAHAIAAAKAGKAIFLEKPAALNTGQLDALMAAVRESGAPLMVGFNRRFSPFMRTIKGLVNQRINPAVITHRMNVGSLPADSWVQGSEGGGRIIGEACHIFDLFNYLIGATPVEVVALPVGSPDSEGRHIVSTDNFTASVRYPDGSLCTLNYTSLGSTDMAKEAMEVFFDGKCISMDDFQKISFFGISSKSIQKSQQNKGHIDELLAFADYLQGKSTAPMTLEEIEAATRTSFIVDELVRSGTAG